MSPSIPASALVNIIPSVLSAGGSPLSLNSVFLTADPSIPVGTVQGFPSALAVQNWFGPAAQETLMANVYFGGFNGCTILPGMLYFAQANLTAAVAAYIRGGSVSSLTLAQLQMLTGTITIAINGETVTSAAINLSSATSFSSAATLINTGLESTGDIFSGTASTAGSSTTLTIATTVSGALHVGDVIAGTGITGGTTIASFGTYTVLAGTGTVILSAAANVSASTSVTVSSTATCTYDSLRQAFVITSPTTGVNSTIAFPATSALATGLNLTAATGAVLSQGSAIAVPATVMASVVAQTQNWALFTPTVEPSLANKELFAAWVQTTNQRYCYVNWDSYATPTLTPPQNTTLAAVVNAAGDYGVVSIYDPSALIAAFFCGMWASVDFTATNGSITSAFKGQAGITPNVTSQTIAANLTTNGYNFYGAYATANQAFQFFQNGQISGSWDWADEYIEQIYLNASIQLAFMTLLSNVKQIPYNDQGYNLMRAAALGPINQFLNFGGIEPGTTLSASQIIAVNTAAGVPIATTLVQQGYYLQIADPGPTVRGNRGSPAATLWYCVGGSVQQINFASIAVQ